MESLLSSIISVVVGSCTLVAYLCITAWLKAHRVAKIFRRQGVNGPPPSFLSGNHAEMRPGTSAAGDRDVREEGYDDYCKTIFPYFDKWRKAYGETYVCWLRRRPALYVTDPGLIREIGRCVSMDLGKPTYMQKDQEPLFGRGVLKSNGPHWFHQRKVIAPQFYTDKVKGMVDLIVDAAKPLLRSWGSAIDKHGGAATIDIDDDVRSFSFDVISRACFGSDYSKGTDIFQKLTALSGLMAGPKHVFALPSLRWLPTERNRKTWRLTQDIRSLILQLVRERRASAGGPAGGDGRPESDFLGSIVGISGGGGDGGGDKCLYSDDSIVDNCKNIYFAGHETSATTAIWCLMLLAAHPEWQDRARAEVLEVCTGGATPDIEMIGKMRTLTMVVQEALRLFSPSSFVVREAFSDMRLGRLHVPKGTYLFVPISAMHHDPAVWGPGAGRFDPGRFRDGVSAACKHPQAFMPFGLGARTCLGQNLAMVEVKALLAEVLARYGFELSSEYRHSPAFRLTIQPEFGVSLVMRRVGQDGMSGE